MAGKASVFLPFNKGRDDGAAGNPVNPTGLKTDYLWEEDTDAGDALTDIIENYTQKLDDTQIWPRYHQLQVVRNLLDDAASNGAGKRYLIQHSAGSGKSNSIAWLSRQLIELANERATRVRLHLGRHRPPPVLDKQINGHHPPVHPSQPRQ